MPETAQQREQRILKIWESKGTFAQTLAAADSRPFFSFFDGPPFATGLPHYGHILASTTKDLVGRYWTMRGYHVPRRWGWDCHGLPIENIIEAKLGISGKKQIEAKGIDVFNNTCREAVFTYADEWEKTIHRIGRWVDFSGSYKTMDPTYMESVWWGIKQIWDKQLIYEGRKVLLYCSRCETPISNFEVAMDNSYQDVTEESVFVRFRLTANKKFPDSTSLLAWTTTPWTLPANWAVAVNENTDYVLVKTGQEHLIVAKERLDSLTEQGEVLREFPGADLAGLHYEPLYELPAYAQDKKMYQVYTADLVTTEEGTGLVHMAPYGEEDFQLATHNKLALTLYLNEQGHFNDHAPKFLQGKYFKQADKLVKKDLEERGLLYKRLQQTHSYPFCWRCASPLFYNPIPAWFINIQRIKKKLLQRNQEMNWYPDHLKTGRFQKGIENAPDWNISRNRFWATPLPFWRCDDKSCDTTICIGSYAELKEKALNFTEVYGDTDLTMIDIHRPLIDRVKIRCEQCNGSMTRVTEVVDCWVESASMPFAELHYPFENKESFKKRFPAHFVAEYIAQTRAWFYVTHVISTILFDRAPFRNVVTTGTILNEKGEKLSKSKRNYPDPAQIIEKYGVDALRFYLMSSAVMNAENLFFSERGVDDVYKKVILLLTNSVSFYQLYPHVGQATIVGKNSNHHVLDRWILARTAQLMANVETHLGTDPDNFGSFATPAACREIRAFIDELSTWYLRRSRERFKAGDRAGLAVFQQVLLVLSRVLAPFIPFLAEDIYKKAGGLEQSVHLDSWPSKEKQFADSEILNAMEQIRSAAAEALAIRADKGLKVRQPLTALYATALKLPQEYSAQLLTLLQEEVNVKTIVSDKGKGEWVDREHVSLNVTMSEELKKEGALRDIIRMINQLRKKQGFTIQDKAVVCYQTASPRIAGIFQEYQAEILAGTLSLRLESSAAAEHSVTVGGQSLKISVVKQ